MRRERRMKILSPYNLCMEYKMTVAFKVIPFHTDTDYFKGDEKQ